MKYVNLLIWVPQLGLSAALPLGGFIWLAVWLRSRFDLGQWVIVIGVIIGIICAADGLRTSLKAMEHMAENKEKESLPVSFNEHE